MNKMKKEGITIILLLISSFTTHAQKQRLNMGLDFSYGMHYYNDNIGNPFMGNLNIGYEYVLCDYLGLGFGVRAGGFSQDVERGYNELKQKHNVYRGNSVSFFISPKVYYPIDIEKNNTLFIESKFLRSYTRLNVNETTPQKKIFDKKHFTYEIKAGYEFPVNDNWNMCFWLGYNSFDFAIVNSDAIKFKSSTPLQVGVGFNYLLSKKQ